VETCSVITNCIVRYGKFAVLDLLEYDVWDAAKVKFDTVLPGLLDSILNKELLNKEVYVLMYRYLCNG